MKEIRTYSQIDRNEWTETVMANNYPSWTSTSTRSDVFKISPYIHNGKRIYRPVVKNDGTIVFRVRFKDYCWKEAMSPKQARDFVRWFISASDNEIQSILKVAV